MVKDERKNIRVGNTFALKVEALGPKSSTNLKNRPEVEIDSAIAEVWDVVNQEFLPIGGVGVLSTPAIVVDNTAEYVFGPPFTDTVGDYKIFLTATFVDGKNITYVKKVKVLAKS